MPNQRIHEPDEHRTVLRRHRTEETAESMDDQPASHPLIALQRQLGNAAVARMLGQRASEEEEEEPTPPDTKQEEEEDKIQAKHDLAQRASEDEEEQPPTDMMPSEEEDKIQAMPEVGLEGGPLSADLSSRINAKRGSGAALDQSTRTSMEDAFGTSFEDVRVHADSESDALNRSISAKAFTTGSDIFFRKDANPSDSSLIAHELTHVVQQRSMSGGGPMTVGPAGDTYEQQADSMSSAVTSGAAPTAQRQDEEEEQEES